MKWELANWSSRSRRPYLSGVPVLHFWPPLSPSNACEGEEETSGYSLSKCSITDIKRPLLTINLPRSTFIGVQVGACVVRFKGCQEGHCLHTLPVGLTNGICPIKMQISTLNQQMPICTQLYNLKALSLQASSA